MLSLIILTACSAAAAGLFTGLIRNIAQRRGMLDVPNARSSHTQATPRGGGLAIVLSSCAAFVVLSWLGDLRPATAAGLIGGGAMVAAVGWMDDRRAVPASIRLLVHVGAAIWALAWMRGFPPLRIGASLVHLGYAGDALGVLAIAWTLNLFNFMDGIDGLAASEAIFVAWGGAGLSFLRAGANEAASAALVFGGSCLGFLFWNWAPARIFLGDVGSGYLGYVIAVLALTAGKSDQAALWVWLMLGGAFFVDATVTLLRRLARRERVFEAHRSHGYQWLARRWDSHRRATIAVILLDLLWLFPCAVLAELNADWAIRILVPALGLVTCLALLADSGRKEKRDQCAAASARDLLER